MRASSGQMQVSSSRESPNKQLWQKLSSLVQRMETMSHTFKSLAARCLFRSFWEVCGVFVLPCEGDTGTNQAVSVRDLWSDSKEISHCCPSWYEVTELTWLQIDPPRAGKLLWLPFPLCNPWIQLILASSSFAKWWITDQRLSLWQGLQELRPFQLTLSREFSTSHHLGWPVAPSSRGWAPQNSLNSGHLLHTLKNPVPGPSSAS